MALLKLTLQRFRVDRPLVQPNGQPTNEFTTALNNIVHNIEVAFNSLVDEVTRVETAITNAGIALDTVTTLKKVTSLSASYTVPGAILSSVVSTADATKAKIVVAAHIRHYGDGTEVNVAAGSIDLLEQGKTYYVAYDQTARSGGVVTYQSFGPVETNATAYLAAAQTGEAPHPDRHLCGSIVTAVAGGGGGGGGGTTTYGGGPRPIGSGEYYPVEVQQ